MYWLIITTRKQSLGQVIFLHLSVILFTGGGVPGQVPTPWAGTPPWQVHLPGQVYPWAGTPPLPQAVHAGIRLTSGRYASYWNAFLFPK